MADSGAMTLRTMTVLSLTLLAACAEVGGLVRPAPPEPPLTVEVSVRGLRRDEQEQLHTTLCSLSGVSACEQRGSGGSVVYALTYAGSLSSLRSAVARIEHPGLETEEVKASLKLRGFDNQPPTITLLSPKVDGVLTETKIDIVVEVPEKDIASVRIGERNAEKTRPGIYHANLTLAEGQNNVQLEAVDEAGNKASLEVRLNVDTTPPDVTAIVKIVVEGKAERGSTVFVDGQPVAVDLLGNYRAEIVIKRGQRTVEIVAIDEHGNKKVEQRSIGVD